METKDFSRDELAISSIDSLNELHEKLTGLEPKVILGGENEGLNGFFHLSFSNPKGNIGLCSSGRGKFSGCKKLDDKLLIFNDQKLFILDKTFKIDWEISFDGTIYEVIARKDKVVVVHEIGINCFSTLGEELWAICTDLITDHTFDAQTISITTDEGSKTYSLIDGELRV